MRARGGIEKIKRSERGTHPLPFSHSAHANSAWTEAPQVLEAASAPMGYDPMEGTQYGCVPDYYPEHFGAGDYADNEKSRHLSQGAGP